MNNPIGQRFCGNCSTRLLPEQTGRPQKEQPPIKKPAQPASGPQSPPQRPAQSPVQPQQQPQRRQPPLRQKGPIQQPPAQKNVPTASEIGRQMRMQQVQTGQSAIPSSPTAHQKQPEQPAPGKQSATPRQAQQQVANVQQLQSPGPSTKQAPQILQPEIKQVIKLPEAPGDKIEQVTQTAPVTPLKTTDIPPSAKEEPPIEGFSLIEEDIIPVQDDAVAETTKQTDELKIIDQPPTIEEDINIQEIEEVEEEEVFSLESVAQSLSEPEPEEDAYSELLRFAVLSVEIVNFSSLSERLESAALLNIRSKVWSAVKNCANNNNEQLVEVADNIGVIPFAHAQSKQQSSILSIQIASEIFEMVEILNQQFETTQNASVKIKIGIAFNDAEGVSQLERSIASAWSIVVSEEIKKDTEGICKYDTIGPLPIGNQMVSFFKYKLPEPGEAKDFDSFEHDDLTVHSDKSTYDSSYHKKESYIGAPPKVDDQEPLPDVETKTLTRDSAISSLVNICSLADSTGKGQFVSIIGEDGLGKSTVIRALKSSMSPQSFIWMISRCNYQEQIMPLSAIKNLLRNFFGISSVVYNREEAKATIKSGLEAILGPNDQLCYVLYSLLLGEEITGLSKAHIVNTIYTILRAISERATGILIIEDLDAIDNTSFEILEALIETKILDFKIVVIATIHPNLNFVESKPHLIPLMKYSQINLSPLKDNELDNSIQEIIQAPLQLPDKIKNQMLQAAKGLPFILENALFLMYELGVVVNTEQGPIYNEEAAQWDLPPNIQEILRLRLHRLSQVNPNAFMMLQMASVLGPKFSPTLLQDLTIQGKPFEESLQFLGSLGYILLEDANMMTFKHNIIWELMYYAAIPNESKAQYHMQVYSHLEKIQQQGGRMDLAYIAYHAEHAGKKRKCLNYWNLVANQILTLGVNTGYSETMMRYINILDESDIHNKAELQINAMEGIAKIVHITDPDLATQALQKILPVREQEDNTARLIELRGYLSLSYEQSGRWDEAIQEINKSLELVNKTTMPIERTILMTSMLSPMETMGKVGWILSTCKNEIFPVLEDAIKNKKIPAGMTEDQLYRILCSAKVTFVNALITSGHKDAFEIFNEIMPEIERRGLQDLGLKAYILQAKWRAMRGEIEFSEKILTQTREYLNQIPGINHFSLLWGEAACYLNLELGNWEVLKNIVEGLRIQAKKLNNFQIIALCKICQGLLAQVEGNTAESLNLFNDAINYSSQYKLTTFALMSWYFISASELQNKNLDKAESIALKALEIAKMPDVYNLGSLITFNRLLGEIYTRKGEIEKAGTHLEEAWKMATEIENHTQVAKVAISIGQMYQELISLTDENKKENAEKAYEFLSNALNMFKQLGHTLHTKRAEKSLENLKVICKVNSINI